MIMKLQQQMHVLMGPSPRKLIFWPSGPCNLAIESISATALARRRARVFYSCLVMYLYMYLYLYLYLYLVLGLVFFFYFNVLGGRKSPPPGWPGRAGAWGPPSKTFQKQWKNRSFLNPFSNAFLDRFLVHFASQLASQNPLTCVKNRCRDTFHLGLHFRIDFWSIFPPNLDPLNPIWH